MRIGILSRNPALYSTRRLLETATARGHDARVIDTMRVALEVGTSNNNHQQPTAGQSPAPVSPSFPQVDAIIPRIGSSITFYGRAVVRQFEATGAVTTATSAGIGRSRDKLHSMQLMHRHGLPIPRTTVVANPRSIYPAVRRVGGTPLIIKLTQGTQGRGVILARNLRTVAAVLEKVRKVRRRALLQEFIAEAAGRDLRVIVVGGRCVAAMERQAVPGEYRANLHRGGSAVPVALDEETSRLAVAAADVHDLSVAGVDLLRSKRGPLVLEVNSSPGLQGIEETTQVDVAGAIITFLETLREGRTLVEDPGLATTL